MSERNSDQGGGERRDEDLWSAIATFEQILEALPEDRVSLEALCEAYSRVGDHARATEYTIRLGEVLLKVGDLPAAQALLPRLDAAAALEPAAGALARKIRESGPTPEGSAQTRQVATATGVSAPTSSARKPVNIAEEMSCAWNLFQAGELTQEEYAAVVHDLTELSVQQGKGTVSVLHILEGRKFRNLEKIIAKLTKDCGTPFVSLANFELRHDVASLLPLEFVVRRGALIFDLLGRDALVVVMNPYDRGLQAQIVEKTGRRCHFFVTLPSEFDAAVEKLTGLLRKVSAGKSDSESLTSE